MKKQKLKQKLWVASRIRLCRQLRNIHVEKELRRSFRNLDHRSIVVRKWDYLELRAGGLRFVYDLKSHTWSWQRKTAIDSHGVICPTVEKCYHSLESREIKSITELGWFVPRCFFFTKTPTVKYSLHRKNGISAYVRSYESMEMMGFLELEVPVGSRATLNHMRTYYSLARKYGALPRVTTRLMEPKVRAVSSTHSLFG